MRPLLVLVAVAHAQPVTDDALEQVVHDELRLEDLDVRVREGIVQITGTVGSLLARDRAVEVARSIRGVRAVVDRLEVEPDERLDDDILRAIEARLAESPVTEPWEVDVTVDRGVVFLDGRVDSWQERDTAERVARSVEGARVVVDRIAVEAPEDRPDAEIRAEIEARLTGSVPLSGSDLEVAVEEGAVRLSGTVASAGGRALAERLARVAGVVSVDGSEIEVAPGRRGLPPPRSDEVIEATIRDAWRYDPRVSRWGPDLAVSEGRVTLQGEVPSVEARLAAEEDAWHTVGVVSVDNRLQVRPLPGRPSDRDLEATLDEALRADPVLDVGEVDVSVSDGVAHLTGEVDSRWERARAAWIAGRTLGVTEVDNDLEVALWTPDPTEWLGVGASKHRTDFVLERATRAQLFWSPAVDHDEIVVEAHDGVVRLTGTVDDWYERAMAAENAFEAGAVEVDNDLEVRLPAPGP